MSSGISSRYEGTSTEGVEVWGGCAGWFPGSSGTVSVSGVSGICSAAVSLRKASSTSASDTVSRKIRMVQGSERNLKITTIEDLETFETILKGGA